MDVACAACDFLGDFTFNSDVGGLAVLEIFDRIVDCFMERVLAAPTRLPLKRSIISLCANIVSVCQAGHLKLVPLVVPVFLPIIRDPGASDRLLSSTILLLANLSMTVSKELRDLGA